MNPPAFVVNADDLGLSASANRGIFRAFDEGCLTSASCAVTTPAFDQAVAGIRLRPNLGIGLHFSLSAGHAVAPAGKVSLLTDKNSRLDRRFAPLAMSMHGPDRAAMRSQIAVELDAQLEKMRDSGIEIDHINGERHVHLIPGVFEVVAEAARKHGIRHIRMIDDVSVRYLRAGDLVPTVTNGGWIKYALLQSMSRRAARLLRQQGRLCGVRYASILFTGRMHRVLDRFWANPPPGITELAIHPGLPDGKRHAADTGNAALEDYLQSNDRVAELQACISLAKQATTARLMTFAEASRYVDR